MPNIFEWRGVENLVAAEILKDDVDGIVYGSPFAIAGTASIGRTTENATETHYYDNIPAIVITSEGADTITCGVSGIPLDVLAKITGQTFDELTGALIEGERVQKYFALGYKTSKTDGTDVYVWRLKGSFAIPDSTHNTKNASAEANGQEVVFTGISTTYKFIKTGKQAKAVNVDAGLGLADVSNFFASVQTPDTLTSVAVAKPVATPESGEVASGDTVALSCATAGATIYYTTDGSVPDDTSTVYSAPIAIVAATTIKAIAVKTGLVSSGVATFVYNLSV